MVTFGVTVDNSNKPSDAFKVTTAGIVVQTTSNKRVLTRYKHVYIIIDEVVANIHKVGVDKRSRMVSH